MHKVPLLQFRTNPKWRVKGIRNDKGMTVSVHMTLCCVVLQKIFFKSSEDTCQNLEPATTLTEPLNGKQRFPKTSCFTVDSGELSHCFIQPQISVEL